jgi:hypothetical protein
VVRNHIIKIITDGSIRSRAKGAEDKGEAGQAIEAVAREGARKSATCRD